jgi:hypothetical protein
VIGIILAVTKKNKKRDKQKLSPYERKDDMSVLIFSIVIGMLKILSNQTAVSHADIMVTQGVISSYVEKQQIHSPSYSPIYKGIVEVVPALSFASCYTAQRYSVTLSHNDLPSDGPTCTPASSRNPSVSNAGEPILIFPLTEEGTLEEKICVAITAPQSYCDIPSGSLLSAFPLV